MPDDINLPPRPEPDGFLTIRIIGRDVEVNAYRDSTMDEYARAAVEADRAQLAAEIEHWRLRALEAENIQHEAVLELRAELNEALGLDLNSAADEAAHGIPAPKGGDHG